MMGKLFNHRGAMILTYCAFRWLYKLRCPACSIVLEPLADHLACPDCGTLLRACNNDSEANVVRLKTGLKDAAKYGDQ